jgi:hypothetical protein
MERTVEKVRPHATAPESTHQTIIPDYDSIDELAYQIHLAEDAGHTVQPQACIEIAVPTPRDTEPDAEHLSLSCLLPNLHGRR